eukprot:CAMPEP_0113878306 /NCGR_PEP_ID=MMETSP0780_2-20120614/6602_1 /TAXON_ID=652834 /ORGANISM="Palpitomonas bilix" /LENGTH=497 /DNA_ID=CAMNT_0000864747 /DNA_START=27 /DNA_END=1520 /DNA_ORIENTATION=+ /assembly_acc=CAM_ASM_000599
MGSQQSDNIIRYIFYVGWFLCFLIYNFCMRPIFFLLHLLLSRDPASRLQNSLQKSGKTKRKVAIVGSGVSGLAAAYALKKGGKHDFTVFEAQEELGGHAYSFEYKGPDGSKRGVDVGFIFGHYFSYAQILEIYNELGIELTESAIDLSVNYHGEKWATDLNGFDVSQEEEREVDRFNRLAGEFKDCPALNLLPFGLYCSLFNFSDKFCEKFVTPSLCTLFISKTGLYRQSARFMLNMFAGPNRFVDLRHGTRTWVVKNGSRNSVQKLAQFLGKENLRVNTPVESVERGDGKVNVVTSDGGSETFDDVILCCHVPQTKKILKGQNWIERLIFNLVRYHPVDGILHTDDSVLPEDKRLHRHFNYWQEKKMDKKTFELTGRMSAIFKHLDDSNPLLYTLCPHRKIEESKILLKSTWHHQVQDIQHLVVTRALVPMIQGLGNVWHGNSWVLWLGHSGAYDAGMAVAAAMGGGYHMRSSEANRIFGESCMDMFGPTFKYSSF